VYSNSFQGAFVFDDYSNIIESEKIRSLWPPTWFSGQRPWFYLSLALNYSTHELDPFGYHFFNFAVHLAAGLTLFGLVRRTLALPNVTERYRDRADSIALMLSPLLIFTALVVELLAMAYFSGRRILLIGLASAIAMHLAIFASSGIFFWKWIVLDLALMAVVLRLPDSTTRRLFQIQHHIVFCLFLVPSCLLYATAPKLAWFDAPLCQRYHIEIVGKSGSVYQVPPSELAPFDLQFAQGRLFFADSDPMIVDCFGSCNRVQVLRSAEAIHTDDDLRRFQSTMGQAKYNAQLSSLLQRTLRNYLQTKSVERQVPVFGLLPDPPQHIWTFPDLNLNQDVWSWQESAKEIRIRKLTVSHLKGEVRPIQEKTVLRIAAE
jgi:hypothetical protein